MASDETYFYLELTITEILNSVTLLPTKKAGLYHSTLVGNSTVIALYVKGIVQNMEDHFKDLQNESTQHMLTPRKSYL